jgi:hypothetical protein
MARACKYELYLLNDTVNSFDHVVEALHNHIPLCNRLRASQMAVTADAAGICPIYSGGEKEVYLMYSLLRKQGLHVDAIVKK